MRSAVLRIFADRIANRAANSLGASNPLLSAQTVFSRPQKIEAIVALVIVVTALLIWPLTLLIVVTAIVSVAFLLATGFKYVISLRGSRYDVVDQITTEQVKAFNDDDLPVYTVLVPVSKEANIVAQLLGNLSQLDYPRDKVEVLSRGPACSPASTGPCSS